MGPSTANSAAAKKAARRPYRRRAALHSSVVAPEHEDQRQDPRPGQAARVVGERAERRVDHRRTGEVVRERRDRPCHAASSPTAGARPTDSGPRPGTRCRPGPAGATAASGRSAPAAAASHWAAATGWAGPGGAKRCARRRACLPGTAPAPTSEHSSRVCLSASCAWGAGQSPTRLPGTPASLLSGVGRPGCMAQVLAYRETRGKPGLPGVTAMRRTRPGPPDHRSAGKGGSPSAPAAPAMARRARPQTVDEQVKQPARPGPPVALGVDPPQESHHQQNIVGIQARADGAGRLVRPQQQGQGADDRLVGPGPPRPGPGSGLGS